MSTNLTGQPHPAISQANILSQTVKILTHSALPLFNTIIQVCPLNISSIFLIEQQGLQLKSQQLFILFTTFLLAMFYKNF
jgi:hypothetical protein